MGMMWKIVLWLSPYASPTLMLLYPLYASVRAIESPHKDDDQQWLSYWIIYSFLTLFELGAEHILQWIPLWQIVKLVLACWLVLPQFNGAAFAYERFLRPHILQHLLCAEEKLTDRQNKVLQKKLSPEARTVVARTDDGKEEFDKGISRETMQTSKAKPSARKQATFKRTSKLRKRTTTKVLECFGVNN